MLTQVVWLVDKLERSDAIQRDRLERWVCVNFMKFKKTKFKILHLDWENAKHKHRLKDEWIESSPLEKELRVFGDENLDMT